jgi:hypothetical protein
VTSWGKWHVILKHRKAWMRFEFVQHPKVKQLHCHAALVRSIQNARSVAVTLCIWSMELYFGSSEEGDRIQS